MKMKGLSGQIYPAAEAKNFYKKVLLFVLPIALQNLINASVTTADVVMLGKVSETVLSGSSLAGQIQFILNLIFFGITSGASVLTAQYWGKKDIRTIEKVIGIALRISLLLGFIFTAITQLFPGKLMSLFTSEQAVIAEGVKYLRIVSYSYLMISVTMIYLNIMRSVERVIISTVVYLVSLIVNVTLNAILIFGLLGAPAMGIRGAALATLFARFVELILVAWYAHFKNKEIKIRIKDLFGRNPVLFRDFMAYSLPVIMNEMLWGVGYSAYAAIIGHMGSAAVAANSVAQVARNMANVVSMGIASAAAVMIGNVIGENRYDLAKVYGKRFSLLAFCAGLFGFVLILGSSPFIVSSMALSEQAVQYLFFMLKVMAVYVIMQAVNSTWIVGVFRAGGDTKFGLILDIASMWLFSIILAALGAFVFQWSVPVVYLFIMSDELVKLPFSFWRYRSKKWLKNVTR